MKRLLAVLVLCGSGLLGYAAPAPKGPSTEEIRKAIDDLGNSRFAVREKASRFLYEAGQAAEPFLVVAAKSTDEETSNRAKTILDKFKWGLYPNTPPEVVKIIEEFRGGEAEARRDALGKLLRLKPTQFGVLRKLLIQEPNAEARQEMFARLAYQARATVPTLLFNKQLDEAAELLEICLATNRSESYSDYATFQVLRGQVAASIAKFELLAKTANAEDALQHAATLTYLHRVNKDWTKAKLHAALAKNGQLLDSVAWEASDWELLGSDRTTMLPNPPEVVEPGAKAAYARLAGNKAKYDEALGGLRKELTAIEGDDSTAFVLAHALLLNGEGAEAVAVLKERFKRGAAQVFDLLCAQMKYKEAFDLAAKAEKELENEPEARFELQNLRLRKAVMLGILGDKDGATQIFRKEFEPLQANRPDGGFINLRVCVQSMMRAGLRDLAIEFIADTLGGKTPQPRSEVVASLELLYDDKAVLIPVWWQAIRTDKPDDNAKTSFKRITDLLAGKAERKDIERLAGLIEKAKGLAPRPDPLVEDDLLGDNQALAFHAIAEAYRAIQVNDKAEEYFKKAADVPPSPLMGVEPNPDLGIDDDLEILGVRLHSFALRYADYLLSVKKYAEAAPYYHKAWLAQPNDPLPLFMEGVARKQAGAVKDGEWLMDLARWMPLGSERQRSKFSDDLVKRGFVAESQREMQFILDYGWFNSYQVGNIHLRMGRASARKKDYAKAADYYEKDVVSLFRTGAVFLEERSMLTVPELARTYRIRALIAAKKDADAVTQIQLALKALPGNVDLAIGVVPDLERAGKQKDADELYTHVKNAHEVALKDFPNCAELRNGIAWAMVNCRRDYPEAQKHAEKAVSLAPKTASYIDTLAEIHFRQKNRDKALELMKQCAALEPSNPYFRKQLERFAKAAFDSPLPDEETGED